MINLELAKLDEKSPEDGRFIVLFIHGKSTGNEMSLKMGYCRKHQIKLSDIQMEADRANTIHSPSDNPEMTNIAFIRYFDMNGEEFFPGDAVIYWCYLKDYPAKPVFFDFYDMFPIHNLDAWIDAGIFNLRGRNGRVSEIACGNLIAVVRTEGDSTVRLDNYIDYKDVPSHLCWNQLPLDNFTQNQTDGVFEILEHFQDIVQIQFGEKVTVARLHDDVLYPLDNVISVGQAVSLLNLEEDYNKYLEQIESSASQENSTDPEASENGTAEINDETLDSPF